MWLTLWNMLLDQAEQEWSKVLSTITAVPSSRTERTAFLSVVFLRAVRKFFFLIHPACLFCSGNGVWKCYRGSEPTPLTRDVKHIAVISLKCLRSLQEMVKLLVYDNTHFILFLFRLWVYLPPFCRKLFSRSFESIKERMGTHTYVPKMKKNCV
jgi:hypothetical protein